MLSFWYKHCGRITTSGNYISELDGLRFLALGLVFVLHLNHSVYGAFDVPGRGLDNFALGFTHAAEYGSFGVQLFFCISGFILGKPFAEAALQGRKKVKLSAFYLRRLTRLEPPLIIHLTIMLVIYLLFVSKPFTEMLPHYFATCAYLHSTIYGYLSPLNEMTWSLEVEVKFYLSTPLLCLLFWIRSKKLRRAVILLGMVGTGILANDLPRTSLIAQLPFFLAGFLLIDIYLLEWKSKPQASSVGDLVGLFCIALFCLVCAFNRQLPVIHSLLALVFLGFSWAVFRGNRLRRLFRYRFLATVGGMCYTFYLYHLAVIKICARFLDGRVENLGYLPTLLLYLVIIAVVNWVVCSALFILFERPFMNWRPKRGRFLNGLIPARGYAPKVSVNPEA